MRNEGLRLEMIDAMNEVLRNRSSTFIPTERLLDAALDVLEANPERWLEESRLALWATSVPRELVIALRRKR